MLHVEIVVWSNRSILARRSVYVILEVPVPENPREGVDMLLWIYPPEKTLAVNFLYQIDIEVRLYVDFF